jgi:hypothetical protein
MARLNLSRLQSRALTWSAFGAAADKTHDDHEHVQRVEED